MLEVLSNLRNLFKFEPTLVNDGLQTHQVGIADLVSTKMDKTKYIISKCLHDKGKCGM